MFYVKYYISWVRSTVSKYTFHIRQSPLFVCLFLSVLFLSAHCLRRLRSPHRDCVRQHPYHHWVDCDHHIATDAFYELRSPHRDCIEVTKLKNNCLSVDVSLSRISQHKLWYWLSSLIGIKEPSIDIGSSLPWTLIETDCTWIKYYNLSSLIVHLSTPCVNGFSKGKELIYSKTLEWLLAKRNLAVTWSEY